MYTVSSIFEKIGKLSKYMFSSKRARFFFFFDFCSLYARLLCVKVTPGQRRKLKHFWADLTASPLMRDRVYMTSSFSTCFIFYNQLKYMIWMQKRKRGYQRQAKGGGPIIQMLPRGSSQDFHTSFSHQHCMFELSTSFTVDCGSSPVIKYHQSTRDAF
jgi:hypothetical protein